jgi:uncharacterized membrane protein
MAAGVPAAARAVMGAGASMRRTTHRAERALSFAPWAAGLAGGAWILALLLRRADGLGTPAYDLGFFQQVVWSIGGEQPWTSTFHRGSFLGVHFSPILVVPAVVERILGPDPRWLGVLHATVLGAMAPAAFLALRSLLRPARHAVALAAGLAAPVPFWALTQQAVLADFHPEAIGVVLALLAVAAGMGGRILWLWLLAIGALLCREDLGYAVLVAGLAVAARARGPARDHGRLLVVAAAAWTVVVFAVLMPAIRAGAVVDPARYYAWLGQVPLPQVVDQGIARLGRADGWFVTLGLIAGLAALPMLRIRWAVLVIPPVVVSLLSSHAPQALLLLQYPLLLVVPAVVAAGFGARRALAFVARLRRAGGRRGRWARRIGRSPAARALPVTLVIPAFAVAVAQGSVPPFDASLAAWFDRPAGIEALRVVAARVPGNARLLADDGLVAALADRAGTRLLGGSIPTDAYVLLEHDPWAPNDTARKRRDSVVGRIPATGRRLLHDDGRFQLWSAREATP